MSSVGTANEILIWGSVANFDIVPVAKVGETALPKAIGIGARPHAYKNFFMGVSTLGLPRLMLAPIGSTPASRNLSSAIILGGLKSSSSRNLSSKNHLCLMQVRCPRFLKSHVLADNRPWCLRFLLARRSHMHAAGFQCRASDFVSLSK